MTSTSFSPNWVSAPGHTISDILTERGISKGDFSRQLGITSTVAKGLLDGRIEITNDLAEMLETVIGSSKSFWLKRDELYRNDLAKIQETKDEEAEWLTKFPLRDMVKNGWILPQSKSKAEKMSACLDFFNVSSVSEWYNSYNDLLYRTAFRTSSSFDSEPESVIAWLRQGIKEAEELDCSKWDKEKFAASLVAAKALSRIEDPAEFLPMLQQLFGAAGVALVVVRTPTKCHASGATFLLRPDKRLMILSFRYLTDDHFWFSLFHEAGHLLLHDSETLHLEGMGLDSKEEMEANEFSAQVLVPAEFQSELDSFRAKDWKSIVRFAKKIGVSKGVVAGQLQHKGKIRRDQLNKLKTRYKWSKGTPAS